MPGPRRKGGENGADWGWRPKESQYGKRRDALALSARDGNGRISPGDG
jgi:hypothetical protein